MGSFGWNLRSSFLVGFPIQGLLAYESYFRALSTSLSYYLRVLSVLLGLFRLLGVPPSAASLFIHLVALLSIAWLYQLINLPLFVAWSFFLSRWSPPLLFLLDFLVVVSFSGSGLLSPFLSPILELPLALEGLSLLPRSNPWFPPRRGSPFGPSQLLFGFFALLLFRLSFAHRSNFPYVCLLLLLYCSFSSLRSLVSDYYRLWGFTSYSVLL